MNWKRFVKDTPETKDFSSMNAFAAKHAAAMKFGTNQMSLIRLI